jgi:hypothetical protein
MDEERDDAGPASPASLKALARELLEQARHDPAGLSATLSRLSIRKQAELALMLPASQRLQLLIHAPKPMRLVRALPDADYYLTVREVGPVEALPLVSLASTAQTRHLLDLESWRKDRFDADRCGAWVALLVEAGESPTRRFLRDADDELLALLFRGWIHAEQIEYEDGAEVHGHGEGEAGSASGALTPDGYHRFSPRIPEHLPVIHRLLQLFYREQPARYQQILWRSRWELPAELEESAFHWRQSRLEEHGFPALDEALAVYAEPSGTRAQAIAPQPDDPDRLAASRCLVPLLAAHGPLAEAIDLLPEAAREHTLHGLVSVANRLLVADAEDSGDPEAHRRALNKAAGYSHIALSARGALDSASAAHVLEQVSPLELFREGHARAAELARRARSLLQNGWPAGRTEALDLLDWPVSSRVRALLADRPLYYEVDVSHGDGRPREFAAPEEIAETRNALETAEALGRIVVELLGLDTGRLLEAAERDTAAPPRFSTVLLTVMAWQATRGVIRGEALPADVAADFVRSVASRRTAGADAPARALEALVRALDARFGLEEPEISILMAYGKFALERLSEECGALDPGLPLEPRYVSCLFLDVGDKRPAE